MAAFLILVVIVLAYENVKLCTQYKVSGNFLFVGRMNCKKTFCPKVSCHYIFGKLIQTEWVSKITLRKQEKLKFSLVLVVWFNFIILKIRMN